MTTLALPLSHDGLDAPLSDHFGKCKWLAILSPGAAPRFLRNQGLNGRWVAEALAAAGVTDVVAGHMGDGAFRQLAAAGLAVWQAAPAGATGADQAARHLAGQLARMTAPPAHDHGAAGGCGCKH
jgi:predicted Fe-Mo cluster-binding NifX family protein